MSILELFSLTFLALLIWDVTGFIILLCMIISLASKKATETNEDVEKIFDDFNDEVGTIVGANGRDLREEGKHLSAGEWFIYMLRWPIMIKLVKEASNNM